MRNHGGTWYAIAVQGFNDQRSRAALRRHQVLLLLFGLSLAVVGRYALLWPIKPWTMFSTAQGYAERPPPQVTWRTVEAIDSSGKQHRLQPSQLFDWKRHNVLERALRHATEANTTELRRASREFLRELVARALPDTRVSRIEIVELSAPLPAASPPVLIPSDAQVRLVGTFNF